MSNDVTAANARQACLSLISVAEQTGNEEISKVCQETITFLCDKFGITVFGLLTKNRNGIVRGEIDPVYAKSVGL